MRFNRYGWFEFNDTPRKRLAFARKQRMERERYPLFAEEIAAGQVDVDTEMAQRQANWIKHEITGRAARAKKWREARARLAAYSDSERGKLLAYWQRCGWPGDPTYLVSMLHMYAKGRLDLDPLVIRETEANRQAVAATIQRLMAQAAARTHGKRAA